MNISQNHLANLKRRSRVQDVCLGSSADGGLDHELGLAAVAEQRARRGVIVDLDGDQRGVAVFGLLGDDEHFLAVGGQGAHGVGGIELEIFSRLADAGRASRS